MRDTYGLIGSGSLRSAGLQSSLESKLVARMEGHGSTLYRLTWKYWDMKLGEPIFALRASVPRILDSVFGSWPSPVTSDAKNLEGVLAGWPTTVASDSERVSSGVNYRSRLNEAAYLLAGFGGKLNGSPAEMESGGQLNPHMSRWLMGLPPAWDICAPTKGG